MNADVWPALMGISAPIVVVTVLAAGILGVLCFKIARRIAGG